MADADERELLAGCRRGETASLRQLVDRHYDPLHRFLWRLTASPDTAEELTQEGLVRALGRIHRVGGGARFFDADRVLRETDILADIGVDYLYLMDPTFNNNLPRAKQILRHIIEIQCPAARVQP